MNAEMEKVTKEEFERFIKDYPKPLETNFFMDWLDYYDFPKDFKSNSLEETYSHKVARHYFGYGYEEYYILKGDKE